MATNTPGEDLQDVIGTQLVDVLAGMQHDLADQTQSLAAVTFAEPAFDRGRLNAGEHIRPHNLPHPIKQAVRPVDRSESHHWAPRPGTSAGTPAR